MFADGIDAPTSSMWPHPATILTQCRLGRGRRMLRRDSRSQSFEAERDHRPSSRSAITAALPWSF